MLYLNASLSKCYHNTHDSKLLIRKGFYFLHPVSPSHSCFCLFALHLLEEFLCQSNKENTQLEDMFVYGRYCSDSSEFHRIVERCFHNANKFLTPVTFCSNCRPTVCGYAFYFWTSCQPEHTRTTRLHFHFYEQSGYLCQGDWWREFSWINVIVPLACQGACPPRYCFFFVFGPAPPPTHLHIYKWHHSHTFSHYFSFWFAEEMLTGVWLQQVEKQNITLNQLELELNYLLN